MPKTATKTPVKKIMKPVTKAAVKPAAPKTSGLSAPVYSLLGANSGNMSLPKDIFGSKINEPLLAQAMRVYLTNRAVKSGSTKTRGEVAGSTRKIYSQKGTGRARHGGIRAPIFIGGGIAMGPKPRKTILDLPKKMKKAALVSALSLRARDGEVSALSGLDKATGKTKEIVKLLEKLGHKQTTLVVGGSKLEITSRAIRNLQHVDFRRAEQVNVFDVIAHTNLLISKEALVELEARMKGKND